MKVAALLVVVVMLSVNEVMCQVGPVPETFVSCNKNGDVITLNARMNDTDNKYEIMLANWIPTGDAKLCDGTYNNGWWELEVEVNVADQLNPIQVEPLLADANCNVVLDATQTKISLDVFALVSSDIIGSDYFRYKAECDISMNEQTNSGTVISVDDITSIIAQTSATAFGPNIVCTAKNAADLTTPLTVPAALGTEFIMACEVDISQGDRIHQGVHIYNLKMASNAGMKGIVVPLLDKNGCLTTSEHTNKFYTTTTENKKLKLIDGTDYDSTMDYDVKTLSKLTYYFGPVRLNAIFNKGMGLSMNTLVMIFQYKYSCYDLKENQCADQQEWCVQNVRAARSVDRNRRAVTTGDEGNMTLVFQLNIPDNLKSLQGSQQDGPNQQPETPGIAECDKPTFTWMLAAIFGVLLLLVVVICVFLALRLRYERNYKEKGMEGH